MRENLNVILNAPSVALRQACSKITNNKHIVISIQQETEDSSVNRREKKSINRQILNVREVLSFNQLQKWKLIEFLSIINE